MNAATCFNRRHRRQSQKKAPRGDGKCFVVRADEKLTAFLELEATVGICTELACQAGGIFGRISKNQGLNRRERRFSRQLLSLFQTSALYMAEATRQAAK